MASKKSTQKTVKSDKEDINISTIDKIYQNYCKMERAIVNELNFSVNHGPTIGGFREEIWKSLFKDIIPKKFSIERSVFIIDSMGHVSNEVDLAIFDEQYTPYIFKYNTLKFIPIEAVAVVIECKSKNPDENTIEAWVNSIDVLETSNKSIARMAGQVVCNGSTSTQKATRPIKILCYVDEDIRTLNIIRNRFDFIINAGKDKLDISLLKDRRLLDWYNDLNNKKNHKDKDTTLSNDENFGEDLKNSLEIYQVENNSILSLIFQLNQLLMLINNPMLFPHIAYVDMFNKYGNTKN